MKQLDAVRDAPPRGEGIVRWLASGFEPIGGFMLFGFMWFGVSIAVLALIPNSFFRLFGAQDMLAGGVFFLLLQAAFVAWAASRRAAARRLFREGALIEAEITELTMRTRRGVDGTRLSIAFGAPPDARKATAFLVGHSTHLAVGGTVPVLFLPSNRYCAVFTVDGAPTPAVCRRA